MIEEKYGRAVGHDESSRHNISAVHGADPKKAPTTIRRVKAALELIGKEKKLNVGEPRKETYSAIDVIEMLRDNTLTPQVEAVDEEDKEALKSIRQITAAHKAVEFVVKCKIGRLIAA